MIEKSNLSLINKIAILAGGMGKRLRAITGDLPKPMAPIMGIPVLQHQIELCRRHGFIDIALLVHYQSDSIMDYFNNGEKYGVNLTYIVEKDARGTAGALRDALKYLDEQFIVLYADTYADVDLTRLWEFAVINQGDGVLLLHPNDHPSDSDLIEIDDNGKVVAIQPYPHPENIDYPNLVNAAMYVLKKSSLCNMIPTEGKYDLAKHTFVNMLAAGLRLQAYITPEYIKDMGTPSRLEQVERDLINGLPEKLSTRKYRTAVFLDRDGTLNREVSHLCHPEQLELLPGACEAVCSINRAGLLAVGITNQPVLARGEATWDDLRLIHARLDRLLGQGKAYLDRMYICPHHPDKGFIGEAPELKFKCACRKPETGLIDRAVQELDISRRKSWLIGDATSDILAGQRAGLRTILLRTGYAGRDCKYVVDPDYICDGLKDAVQWILNGHSLMIATLMPIAHGFRAERMILLGGAARTGKTLAAKVLSELLESMGRTVHIIPLDAWLKPAEQRFEGKGVLSRYDIPRCVEELTRLFHAPKRVQFGINYWDRKYKQFKEERYVSIGPDDILIVEGVPALASPKLLALTSARIHVDACDEIRTERLKYEYLWRGEFMPAILKKIKSRERDEVVQVKSAAAHAVHKIQL
jgi:histidinol-phosphate phosphatase family protein